MLPWLVITGIVCFQIGRIWEASSSSWDEPNDQPDDPEPEGDNPEPESNYSAAQWGCESCDADLDHDAVICHACGETIDTRTDDNGVKATDVAVGKQLMARLCAMMLVSLTSCAVLVESPLVVSPSQLRTIRVIGTEQDMTQAGEQYCHGSYSLEFMTQDKTEALITCS